MSSLNQLLTLLLFLPSLPTKCLFILSISHLHLPALSLILFFSFYTSVIRLLFNFYLIFLPLHFLHHYRSTNRFCTAERAKEIEEFFEKNPLPSSQRRISQSVEVMRYVRTCVYLCVCVRGGDSVCVHKCMYAFIHTVWALYVLYSIILHHCV